MGLLYIHTLQILRKHFYRNFLYFPLYISILQYYRKLYSLKIKTKRKVIKTLQLDRTFKIFGSYEKI